MPFYPNVSEDLKTELIALSNVFKNITYHFESQYSESFPYIYNASDFIFNESNNPNKDKLRSQTNAFIQGMLLIYFFALWDDLQPNWKEFPGRKLFDYLTKQEINKIQAYRHIRHSVAHKMNGERAIQLRNRFEKYHAFNPGFSSIFWDVHTDKIDLSQSTVGADFADFIKNISIRLTFRVLDEISENKSAWALP